VYRPSLSLDELYTECPAVNAQYFLAYPKNQLKEILTQKYQNNIKL